MNQKILHVAVFVRAYDEAIDFTTLETGIEFVREPQDTEYGAVAMFEDLYGNL